MRGSAPGDAASARAVWDPPRSSPPPARFPGALAAALRLLLQVCHSHGGKNNRFSGSPMKPRGFANTLRLFSHWKHRDDPMGATNAEERPRRDAESQESSGGVAGPGRRPVLPPGLAPAGGSRGKGGRSGCGRPSEPRGLRLCFAPSRHGSPEHRVQGPGAGGAEPAAQTPVPGLLKYSAGNRVLAVQVNPDRTQ